MALGTITSDSKGCKVYCNEKEWNGTVIKNYSITISGKDQKGEWNKAYMNVNFKKGQEPNNKSTIKINKAFFTTKKWGKTYIPMLFIMEYELLEDGEKFQPADDFMAVPDIPDGEMPFV